MLLAWVRSNSMLEVIFGSYLVEVQLGLQQVHGIERTLVHLRQAIECRKGT